MLATEIIRTKRDGGALSDAQIVAFVRGLAGDGDAAWSEGQVAALAMAIVLRGMDAAECAALTRAMTDSGERLDWRAAGFSQPVLDKHSTGGVGDKVSLMLAPIVAACGAVVPMISGRALSHTGGTLDKLQALPGYQVDVPHEQLLRVLRHSGCAIVGASARLAPADRRLYAVRDVTATVESLPLITASILSKKLAAGLQALVMDVKVGNGAFTPTLDGARALAHSLVRVARANGLPTTALITDMNQVLGHTAGNALEVKEALSFLTGRSGTADDASGGSAREPRLEAVTLALAAQLLHSGGLADSADDALARVRDALHSGRAAERFARMVAGLGGPRDVLASGGDGLGLAPVQRDLAAPRAGVLAAMDTRALGLAVVALGGGRRRAGDAIDARVGLSHLLPLGTTVAAGEPLLRIHAADGAAADAAAVTLLAALTLADHAPAPQPVVVETIAA